MAKYFTQPGETAIGAQASDGTPRHAKLDTSTHTLQFIDYAHHEVHGGSHFFLTYPFTLAATTDVQDFLIDTPNTTKWAHMIWDLTGSAITEVKVYEDTGYTSTDAITTFNNNRNSSATPTVVVYNAGANTLSSTDAGTLIWNQKSGASSNQSRSSMKVGNTEEIILKQNSVYRIRYETGTATNLCNLKLEWYEHTNST
jgi:hypothetical protein